MNFFIICHVAFILGFLEVTCAFSTPQQNFLSTLTDIFQNSPIKSNISASQSVDKNDKLKDELISLCNNAEISESDKRGKIEDLIQQLKEVNPIKESARSPLLRKNWLLVWTTEKEINFFINKNISGQITQSIENNNLQNNIPFKKGGSFSVNGELSVPNDDDVIEKSKGMRTEFEFKSATLDIGKWGVYSFPPIGKGWFDTLYLDNNFRIDLNSRDDILICKCD